jgi:hypothetical protein
LLTVSKPSRGQKIRDDFEDVAIRRRWSAQINTLSPTIRKSVAKTTNIFLRKPTIKQIGLQREFDAVGAKRHDRWRSCDLIAGEKAYDVVCRQSRLEVQSREILIVI